MANWLLTVDHDEFKLDKAYDILSEIFWENNVKGKKTGLQKGDIIYIYVTKKVAKVMYKMRVKEIIENSHYPKNQIAFWGDQTQVPSSPSKYAVLEKIAKVDKNTLSRKYLLDINLIGPTTIVGSLSDNSRFQSMNEEYKKLFAYFETQFHSDDYPDEADTGKSSFPEGGKTKVSVNKYERSPEARAKCLEIHGTRCYVCTMSFEFTYGPFARDFIHVHHKTPLHEISEKYEVNPETDLIPVCPNCHAMLHKTKDGKSMDIESLKKLFKVSLADSRRYKFEN